MEEYDRQIDELEDEMETDSYDYKKALEIEVNTVEAAVSDSRYVIEQRPELMTKEEEKRQEKLEELCKKYRAMMDGDSDYEKLYCQFMETGEAINRQYR